MFKGKSYESCYLTNLGESFSVDLPANVIHESAIQSYMAEKVVKLDRPRRFCGFEITEDVTRYCVDVVYLPNGKFAFPVYKVTPWYQEDEPWKSREGEMELIGWCVRDDDPFSKYRV